MRHGFFTSFALDDFFLTVTSVKISNSLKNHDELRENGENFVASFLMQRWVLIPSENLACNNSENAVFLILTATSLFSYKQAGSRESYYAIPLRSTRSDNLPSQFKKVRKFLKKFWLLFDFPSLNTIKQFFCVCHILSSSTWVYKKCILSPNVTKNVLRNHFNSQKWVPQP